MNINFANFDHSEKPTLILKTASGATIGILSNAANVGIDVKYNEVSTLEFKTTDRINGVDFEYYDDVVGMRIIELVGVGQFILMNPKETDNGDYRTKVCRCMSLEHEFTRKKITLPKDTYPLWDKNETSVLSMIMEQMPTWSIGDVPDSLKNKYRTFEVNNENLYNFIKGTVQQSYGCIFEFDTISRKVNIVDANIELHVKPVVISTENLAKEIEIEELTDDVHTRIDVTGAEGVDIRSVNPSGNNKLINLDYFMNSKNFSDEIIDKYMAWKADWHNNRLPYYYLSVEYTIEMMRKQTESAALTELNGEFTNLENQRAVIIQSMAMKLSSQSELDQINMRIVNKRNEIVAKKNIIAESDAALQRILSDMARIQEVSKFENHFTQDELDILSVYIKDGEISDSSFATSAASDYSGSGMGASIDYMNLSVSDSNITKTETSGGTTIYDIRGGNVNIAGDIISSVVSAAIEIKSDNTGVISFRLGSGVISGDEFNGANVTVTSDKITVSFDAHEDPELSGYITGTNISVDMESAYRYFTKSTTEYDNQSVSLELMEHGLASIEKLAWPSYTFHVDSANFLTADDYARFRDELSIGRKIYVVSEKGRDLSPICIGASFRYDDLTSLSFAFSDTFSSNDSSFKLVDLLNKSISMGKDVDVSKYVYSEFVDSGANTHIKEFMTSALDVAKNAIMSSSAQAIAWDGAGFRLRKWANDERTSYDDEQIWMNNNSIMMTDDEWETAKMAIGKFFDEKLDKTCWGIVAPMIVGTLLAGSSLIIESAKKDGETAVFRMDEDGCRLYNSQFDIHNELAHITLDPELGVVMGKYPVYSENKEDGKSKIINDDNANFWVDTDGNIHMRGTLHGANGEFTGAVVATSLKIRSNGQDVNIDDYVTGGVNSNSVDNVDVMYYLSSSESELVGGEWSTLAPAWINGWYMWTKMVTKYTNGTSTESDPVNLTGSKGNSGESGRGVVDLTEEYYLSTSKTACVGGQWQATAPTWVENTYIWTRIKITYSDNNVDYTTPVCDTTWESVTALSEKVSVSFEVMEEKIKSRVEKTVFDELGEVVSWHESSISEMPEQIRMAVSQVQVGGRNLLRNTAELKTANHLIDESGASARGNCTEDEFGGFHVVCKDQNIRCWMGEYAVTPGQSYAMSVRYKMNSGTAPIQFQYVLKSAGGADLYYWDSVNHSTTSTIAEDGWTVLRSVIIISDDPAVAKVSLALRTGLDGELYTCDYNIRRPKFEVGNKVTDWSPAPEDADESISKLSAELLIQSKEIAARVTKKEFNALGDEVARQGSEISATPDRIKAAVESVRIGGTNLVRCGDGAITITSGVIDRGWSKSAHCRSGIGIIFQPFTYTYNGAHFYTDVTVEPGEYIFSFWCWTYMTDIQPVLRCNLFSSADGVDHYFKDIQTTANTPVRYEIPISVTYSATVNLRLLTWTKFTTGELYVSDVKLEKGNKATDWSPAPEDVDSKIDGIEERVSTAELKITSDAIISTVTSSTKYTTDLSNINTALNGKVDSLYLTENYSTVKQTDDKIKMEVGKKTVGGTNLAAFENLTFFNEANTLTGYLMDIDPVHYCRSGKIIVLNAFSGNYDGAAFLRISLAAGKQYTVSFWASCSVANTLMAVNIFNSGRGVDTNLGELVYAGPNGGYYTRTFECPVTDIYELRFICFGGHTGTMQIMDVKLEEGNTATAWSASSEDVNAAIVVERDRITAEVTRATNAEGVLSGRIDVNEKAVNIAVSRTVGGTNLLRLSTVATASVAGGVVNPFGEISDVKDETWYYRSRKMIALPKFAGDYCVAEFYGVSLKQGVEYTVSFNLWCGTGGSGIKMMPNLWNEGRGVDWGFMGNIDVVPNIPTRYAHTLTCTMTDNAYRLRFLCFGGNNATIYISDVKLEEGNTATAWSAHPEEYRAGSNVLITENQVKIVSPQTVIGIPGSDGETMVAQFDENGLTASQVIAGNIAYRYNGGADIWVKADMSADLIARGNHYRSLSEALNSLTGRHITQDVQIHVQSDLYGDAELTGASGRSIAIHGNGCTLYGGVKMHNVSAGVDLNNLMINRPASSAISNALELIRCGYVGMYNCKFIAVGADTAVNIGQGVRTFMHDCELRGADKLIYLWYCCDLQALNLMGGECSKYLVINGATARLGGSRPDGTWEMWNTSDLIPVDPNTLGINYGSATPSVPSIQTASWNYLYTDSYSGGWGGGFNDDDARQGYINGNRIYGVIWFDAAAIRNALSGRTINQASLRLHMHIGVGRSAPVSVQLYGTNLSYADRFSSIPPLTTEYYTIGTTKPGELNEITIPTQVIVDIVNGTIQALVLHSDDIKPYKTNKYSENYARFSGSTSADGNTCPRLTVVYQ